MATKKLSKILLIDDDEDILTISKLTIQTIPGLSITCANSGEEGIKKAINEQPDLILLDIMMPMMDGIDTLKALRLIPSTANIPVIFFTAKTREDQAGEYLKYDVLDIIIKPFEPFKLPERILKIWNNYSP